MPKAIFIDLDGTIVYDIFTVIESSRTALEKLRKNGHELFVCTGRNIPLVETFFGDFFDNGVYMAGGLVIHHGERVLDARFSKEELDILTKIAKDHSGIRSYMGEQQIWSEGWINDYFNRRAGVVEASKDGTLEVYDGSPVYKADIRFHMEQRKDYEEAAEDLRKAGFAFSEYLPSEEMGLCLETSKKGISKGAAIEQLCRMGIIRKEDTICIGDSMNDYEMMKVCAYSIAMGNAEEELKKKADYVTDRIENDGFYKAFEYLKLL